MSDLWTSRKSRSTSSHFARVENELEAALAYKNPDVFIMLLSNATEEAIVQASAHNSGERRHYTGHGKATYMLRKHKASKVFQDHDACRLLHHSH